jgi:hypothetical protein
VVFPPIVAAPAADFVFTNDGGTVCFFATVVEVVLVVELVEGVAPFFVARATVVVVVDTATTGFSAKVNSTFVDWLAYTSSSARVMVTIHFPAVAAVRTPLEMLHPALPAEAMV